MCTLGKLHTTAGEKSEADKQIIPQTEAASNPQTENQQIILKLKT